MTQRFGYANPEDPQEEAEIFGLVGPDALTRSPDNKQAESEAQLLDSQSYDEKQELLDEGAWLAFEAGDVHIAVKFSVLSESQRSDVLAFIQKLLNEHENGEDAEA